MSKASESKKVLMVIAGTLGLCAIVGGGIWWAYGLVKEEEQAIVAMRTEVEAAKVKIKKIPRFERDVIILRENLQEYVKILPEAKELNDFVRTASLFQKQAGIAKLTKFEPGKPSRAGKGSSFARYTYRFEFTATLWQFMKMISLFENYERFVKVKSFSLVSGAARNVQRSQSGEIQHRIAVTVETYVYTASSKGRQILIPNYKNKAERLREEILENRQSITSASYEFQGARGRRDIFVDPRESKVGPRTGAIPLKDQKKIISRFAERISKAQSLRARINDKSVTIFEKYSLTKKLKQTVEEMERDISQIEEKGYIASSSLKFTWTREILDPLAVLKQSVSSDTARGETRGRWLTEAMMRKVIADIKADMIDGNLQDAMDRYVAVETKIKVPKSDRRYPLARAIEELHLRAKIANEFSAKRLEFSGVCINQDGKSAIIVNGLVYEEGDYLDDDLLLKAVRRTQVEFIYKGFTVVKAN